MSGEWRITLFGTRVPRLNVTRGFAPCVKVLSIGCNNNGWAGASERTGEWFPVLD